MTTPTTWYSPSAMAASVLLATMVCHTAMADSPATTGATANLATGRDGVEQQQQPQEPVVTKGSEQDPWEGMNRRVFAFNDTLDRWLIRPLAVGYKAVMPDPFERGISNVFKNIFEVPSALNSLLQGNVDAAGYHTGRLLINTTLGFGGVFDMAGYMTMPARDREDFGQTLAVWGVGSGPYVVLPLMGPSTLRDGVALPVDIYSSPLEYVEDVPTRNTITGVSLLNMRAGLLDLEKNLTGDKYTMIRDVYLQRRDYLINNGQVEDSFGAEDEFDLDGFE